MFLTLQQSFHSNKIDPIIKGSEQCDSNFLACTCTFMQEKLRLTELNLFTQVNGTCHILATLTIRAKLFTGASGTLSASSVHFGR